VIALARALFAVLVGAQLVYPRLPAHRGVAATRAIVGLMLAASTAEACAARGSRRGLGTIGAAGAIGFAAELAGTTTGRPFGHYAYSGRLGPRWRGVPLLAFAAWAMMARPAWVVAGLIARRRRLARVVLAAGALTAWDVFLDPRMVREGYWTWPGGGRYEDVPASNYVGWFATGLAIFAAVAAIDGDEAAGDPADLALALYSWTWVGEIVANLAFWGRPPVALVGGAAMGSFAVPALRARLRQRP
jgi:uncharacterized membrane protein